MPVLSLKQKTDEKVAPIPAIAVFNAGIDFADKNGPVSLVRGTVPVPVEQRQPASVNPRPAPARFTAKLCSGIGGKRPTNQIGVTLGLQAGLLNFGESNAYRQIQIGVTTEQSLCGFQVHRIEFKLHP